VSREDPDVIDSVEKAFRLLQVFSAEVPRLSVSEAARRTDLSRATARRLLLTFERLGFARAVGRDFELTPRVLRLGHGFLSSLPLWESALPHMRDLADRLGEACSLGALDGHDIVYLARVPSKWSMATTLTVGSRLPAHATSMGRVLLAGLDEASLEEYLAHTELERLTPHTIVDPEVLRAEVARAREQGWAMVDGERELGVRSVAAPVHDVHGAVVAGVNVSANAARVELATLREEFVPALLASAEEVSRDLGWSGPRG
jgi:IclR family transcriptional regulator, pca regulon regulatory protein